VARDYFEKALALSESNSDTLGAAYAVRFLGGVHYSLGDFQKSIDYYRRALSYFEQAGDLRSKAYLLNEMCFSPALKPEEGLEYLRQALEIGKKLDDKRLQGLVLQSWSSKLTLKGQFSEANEKLSEAATLLEKTGDRDGLARVFTSQGRLLRMHGQPERALEFYEKALKIQLGMGDRQGIIQSYNAMGTAYTAMEDYRKAGEWYQRAYDLALQTGSERFIAFMEGALATNYINLNEYARAAELLEKVVARTNDHYLDYRYQSLAEAYSGLGRYVDALAASEKALSLQRQQKGSELYLSLLTRANLLARLNRPAEGLADLREAMRLLEEQRAQAIPSDLLKQGYSESMQNAFSVAVGLLSRMGQEREALEVAEQGRARSFLDLLATREVALRTANLAEVAELRQVESALQREDPGPAEADRALPAALTTRGSVSAPTASVSALRGRWEKADLELRSFVAAEAFSAEKMAATAKRLNSTILSYWVGDSETHIWVITPDSKVHEASSPVSRDRLVRLIRLATGDSSGLLARGEEAPATETGAEGPALLTRGAMTLRLRPSSIQAWRELHQVLLRPVQQWLPRGSGSRVTVIPHGPLFRLSFAALQDEKGRYLIEQHELHYAPAGAVLEFTRKKLRAAKPARASSYLLVADPANLPSAEGDRALPLLPGARAEVARISQLLPPGTTTTLSEAAALESRVRSGVAGKRVVHFATHGIVRDDSPLDSYLALGAGSSGPREDGRLTAQEIYSLELDADLVFLSACRSGRGKVTGDGVIGLTRAFVYAGTPTVVATLWDVPDEPTQRLVPEFYRIFLKQGNPAGALRAAQLRLLADLRAGRVQLSTPAGPFTLPEYPALWAGFVLIGEP